MSEENMNVSAEKEQSLSAEAVVRREKLDALRQAGFSPAPVGDVL